MGHPRVPELCRAPLRELMALMRSGHDIDTALLEDAEFKGISLGMPAWFERLTWKTFKKTFHRDPATRALRGWNIRIRQAGIDGPYEPILRRGEPFSFGHYEVRPLGEYGTPFGVTRGVIIDYGRGGNAFYDVMGLTRDPLVSLEQGERTLLLGFSYAALGPLRVPLPLFFCLQYDRPLERPVPRPRPAPR